MTDRLHDGGDPDVLREHVASGSIDPVDADPPSNPNADDDILFKSHRRGSQGNPP